MASGGDESYRALLFGIRRSVRYHARRRGFYERFHSVVVFTALLFGSATIAAFGAALGSDEWPKWVAFLPASVATALAAADWTMGSIRKASEHAVLVRRFTELERKLVPAPGAGSETLVSEVTGERLDIEAEEPPVLRVLDTICHNELLRAMGYPIERQVRVGFWQRVFSPFFDWREHTLHTGA